jgi:tetratricopeptide (TPR) repeat protein
MFFTTKYLRFAMNKKSRNLFCVCLVVFSILFVALPGFSQNSALQVKCADSSGNPLSNVKVVAFNLDNQKAKEKKSDAQGNAEFTKLDDGVYRVIGRKDGFAPAFFEFTVLKASTGSVSISLAAGADKKLYFEDEAEARKSDDQSKQAFSLIQQNNPVEAEKLLLQSIEINPSNTDTLFYLALVNLQQSRYDQGVEFLNKATKIASILKSSPSIDKTLQVHYEEIIQKAQQLMLRIPAIKGDAALKQKKYDEAIAAYSEAIKNEPNNPEYYANLAIALTNSKRLDEAVAAISKADQLKPGTYADLKKNIDTRKENERLSKAQAILDEGNKLLQAGDAAGAIQKYEEAKGMVAQDRQAPIWRQIGKANAKLNQPDAAIAAFRKSIELAPADKIEEYRNSFAQFYLDAKKYDEALDVLSDPKTAGSQSVEQVMLSLAQKVKSSNPQIAIAAMERALKANPDNADTYFELGQQYYFDKVDVRSKELLTKYLEIGKDANKIQQAKDLLTMINRRTK